MSMPDAKFRVPLILYIAAIWNPLNDIIGLPWRLDYWQAAKLGGGTVELGLITEGRAIKKTKNFREPIVFVDKPHKIVVYGQPPEMKKQT